jgi:hypothetical protein
LQGRAFVGLVLRDTVVVDLSAADKAVATSRQRVPMPSDMKDLISRYDTGLRERLAEIATAASAAGGNLPAYARQLSGVKTLPPVMYPTTMMNAAVNYREHGAEVVRRDARGAAPATNATPRAMRCQGRRARPASGTGRRTTRAGIRTCS